MTTRRARTTFLIATLALGGVARADTWHVDDDAAGPGDGSPADPYPAIQTAINAATSGDTILVHDGTYGRIDLGTKNLEIVSENGAGWTVISDNQLNLVNVDIDGGQDATTLLSGFTFTGAVGGALGAMYIRNSSPRVEDCLFIGNLENGAVQIDGGSPAFDNCTWRSNTIDGSPGHGGAAVRIKDLPSSPVGSRPTFDCCVFEDNQGNKDAAP